MPRLIWIVLAVMGGGLLLLIANHSSGETFGLENDVFAQTLYLGALAVVLAASFVGSRRLGPVARNLALWLLILVLLVAGYQYRHELQDLANRLAGST